jgi:hypothetical protein
LSSLVLSSFNLKLIKLCTSYLEGMPHIQVCAKLSDDVLTKLRGCDGVNIREESEVKIVELVESFEGQQLFFQLLQDGIEVDPVLLPQFGPLAFPCVPVAVQLEVYDVLQSF